MSCIVEGFFGTVHATANCQLVVNSIPSPGHSCKKFSSAKGWFRCFQKENVEALLKEANNFPFEFEELPHLQQLASLGKTWSEHVRKLLPPIKALWNCGLGFPVIGVSSTPYFAMSWRQWLRRCMHSLWGFSFLHQGPT
ncbi:unnamed protein product [Sphagnum troendelagicum]